MIHRGAVEVIYPPEEYKEDEDNTDEFTSGVFIGETSAMLKGQKCRLTLRAVSDLQVFILPKKDYIQFLESNPKLLINLTAKEVIE